MASKLLLIDDDVVHRMVIRRMAVVEGYETAEAGTVGTAARLLSKMRFDCITLDLSLGEQCGTEILHLLAQHQLETPVILISGCEKARTLAVRLAGVLDVNVYRSIDKPIDLGELRRALRAIRAGRGMWGAREDDEVSAAAAMSA